jgi:hypothetical protein
MTRDVDWDACGFRKLDPSVMKSSPFLFDPPNHTRARRSQFCFAVVNIPPNRAT